VQFLGKSIESVRKYFFRKCFVHAEEEYDSISVKYHRNDEWKGQFSEWSHTTTRDLDIIVKEEESQFDHFRAKEKRSAGGEMEGKCR